MRVKFKKGQQRKFLDLVINNLGCISLRGILQFGFAATYSSLKNYYAERRMMEKSFFDDLCYLAKIRPKSLEIRLLKENHGQVKGGKKERR